MERYTEKHYDGNGHYLLCSGTCETLNCGDCGILDKIVDRLAAYEDTGLTPEEVQQMRWIPVEERLPEEKQRVIVRCEHVGTSVGWILWGNWMADIGPDAGKVTHWMHLPQPPKEEIL